MGAFNNIPPSCPLRQPPFSDPDFWEWETRSVGTLASTVALNDLLC